MSYLIVKGQPEREVRGSMALADGISDIIGRLIECVHEEVDGTLIMQREHVFQVFCQNTVTRLILSDVMGEIKFG